MYAVGRLGSYLSRGVYTVSGPFHPFGGAVDIVVVEQPDGSFKSSPWYVRFGKFQGVLKTKEKVVTISVNGVEANFHMYLDHKGEAYFVREVDVEEGEAPLYPLSSGEEADEPFVRDRRPMKSMSCNFETGKRKSVEQFDAGNGKIVSRTTSRRSRIFGLVFGRRSMKEDSHQEGEDGPGVVRVSSLERAEIAADLLEMKWSTNLVSHNYRKEKSFRFSASGSMKNTGDRDMQVEDKQEKCVSSVFDNDGRKVSDPSLQNETASSQSQRDGNISGSGMEVQDCAEDVIVRMSSVSSTEQDAEASQSVETSLEEKHRVSPNVSRNDYHDETASGSILRSTCDPDRGIHYEEGDSVCSCSSMPNEDSVSESVPSFAYYEASQNSLMRLSGSTEQTCESQHVTGGEYEEASIQVKNLLLRADLSSEGALIKQAEEMELNIEEAITRPEVSYHMTGDNQQLGFVQELELRSLSTTSSVGDSDGQVKTDKSNAEHIDDCVANTLSSPPSESSEEEQFVFSDLDEFKLHRSDYVKNEHHASSARTEKEEYQVTSMSGCSHSSMNPFSQDNQLADVKISNGHSDMTQSPIRTLSSNSKCGKGPQKVESLPDMQSPYSKLDAYYHCSLSHSLDSSSELTKMEFLCKDDSAVQEAQLADISSCNRSSKVTSSPMDILSSQSVKTVREVESFPSICSPYGKLDVYDHPQSHSMDSNLGSLKMEIYCRDDSVIQGDRSADSIENSIKKLRSISIPNDMISSFRAGIEKPEQQGESLPEIESRSDACENHPLDRSLGSSSDSMKTESFSEDNSSGENHPSADSKSSIGTLRLTSNPINILSGSRVASDRSGRQVESLPNMWSSDVKLEAQDRYPLSHSLGSENESRKMVVSSKDELSYQKLNAEEKCQIMDESRNTEVSRTSWNLNDVHKHPAVELSLCKHLLFEGMGADAAARAFDVKKLDLNKFKAIGSTAMKNDRLVVRIGGCYFPWPAAAPILLGMVAFGSQEIFEPKGMIPVDRHEGDQRKDGGSWRIWPFSFKRSQSRINMPIDLTDARNDVGNAVDKTTFIEDVEEILVKPKKVKKMIRATTPTSEQLASLNLKEGSNTVTFTFSTAMLGNQKVDARIYLWKWKTRIVISDVDGTITKSDVLGQFMPLMGVDWSQTGVAHLFSGIKENGYHLLFLSARAISQAYHTRQFLVNLKQDGKALPDGPIVISPDGLFPSLYREVIRRAPHEFKIACLEDIKALFPPDYNPFYAGFGNRDTDEISYLKVGIPKGKIFIINPKGEVAVNRHLNTKSYTSLRTLVNDMFPPVTTSEQEDFNSWNYWKLPPPLIDI